MYSGHLPQINRRWHMLKRFFFCGGGGVQTLVSKCSAMIGGINEKLFTLCTTSLVVTLWKLVWGNNKRFRLFRRRHIYFPQSEENKMLTWLIHQWPFHLPCLLSFNLPRTVTGEIFFPDRTVASIMEGREYDHCQTKDMK